MLESIQAHFTSYLSDREDQFIIDITDRWERYRRLTPGQVGWLEDIFERFARGDHLRRGSP